MLTDAEKNTVFFANCLVKDYPYIYEPASCFLKERGIKVFTIPYAEDFWCRDFMPVQVSEKRFVQFTYRPYYLANEKKFLTDVDRVMGSSLKKRLPADAEIVHSRVVMDGGNMTVCKGRDREGEYVLLIMTDIVWEENKDLTTAEIEAEIGAAIGEKVRFLWLPWEGKDIDLYGHTDAMVRFVGIGKDGRPSIVANLSPYGEHGQKLKKRLEECCNVTEIEFSNASDNNWAPMNFIQTDKAIVVPGIGEPQDEEMRAKLQSLFNDHECSTYMGSIYTVLMPEFVEKWGGALNCMTWTVKL